MKTESITLHADELRSELLPLLLGRVFHVTTHAAFEKICADGKICVNTDGSLTPSAYYRNAYFRSHGCVSVCDLRFAGPEQVDQALRAYYFLNPEADRAAPAFLFLNSQSYPQLRSWREQGKSREFDKAIVPHIEAGFPDQIPLEFLDQALLVNVVHPPPNEHLAALRARIQ